MDSEIDELMIEVRASTDGFRADVETMRGAMDTSLLDGFEKAGSVLERGLLSAIRRGSLGFEDLKRVALNAVNEIAAQALNGGFASLFGLLGQNGGGIGTVFSGALGSVLGLPGRATGGPVSPGRPYLVGERGPEMFVPTAAGRVETGGAGPSAARDVRVSINLAAPRGTDAPVALRRSSRQVASQVRRALQQF